MIVCRESPFKKLYLFLVMAVLFTFAISYVFELIGGLLHGRLPDGFSLLVLALLIGIMIVSYSILKRMLNWSNEVILDDEKGFITFKTFSQNKVMPLREIQEITKIEIKSVVGGRFGGGLEKTGFFYEFRTLKGTITMSDMSGFFDILYYIRENCSWVRMTGMPGKWGQNNTYKTHFSP